jgi:hypothetical protein
LATIESQTVASNISRIGIRIPISRIVHKGDIVRLDIYSDENAQPVCATGKVRWVEQNGYDYPFTVDAGIEFMAIDRGAVDDLLIKCQ